MYYPIVDADGNDNAVVEGAATGTYTGITVQTTDPADPRVYSLLNDRFGAFVIDPVTGRISIGDGAILNYESQRDAGFVDENGRVYIDIIASSDGGASGYESSFFRVYIEDFTGDIPQDGDPVANEVNENAPAGTYTGITVQAVSPAGLPIAYSIFGDTYGGMFAVDPVTGRLTTNYPASAENKLLDYETLLQLGPVDENGRPYLEVGVQAFDGYYAERTTFRIYVNDLTGGQGLEDSDAADNTIIEGATTGTYTGVTAFAVSEAGIPKTYALLSPSGAFAIDSVTGQITVADRALIDFETAPRDGEGRAYQDVTVGATDELGDVEVRDFRIYIGDFAGDQIVDSDETTDNLVTEGAASGTYTGLTAQFVSPHNLPVVYALQGGPGGAFEIDPATGRVTVGEPAFLDFEALRDAGYVEADGRVYYPITVYATDGLNSDSETFKIYIGDFAGDQIVDSDETTDNLVTEGAASGTYTGLTAQFVSPHNLPVVYALQGGPGGAFEIDPATGRVTVGEPAFLDFEALRDAGYVEADGRVYYPITVYATDGLNSDSETFKIYIGDFAGDQIVDSDETTDNLVTEGAASGTYTGLTAQFVSPHNLPVVYALQGGPGGAFEIDPATGRVTVGEPAFLDFEALRDAGYVEADGRVYYPITVYATDGLNSDSETFKIYIGDFAGDQIVDSDETTDNLVTEGAAAGTYTGLTAQFVSPHNLPVVYALQGGPGGAFEIDPATGRVTVGEPAFLDFEALRDAGYVEADGQVYYPITVYATDGLNSDSETFKIYIGDFAGDQIVDSDETTDNLVTEGAAAGTYTGLTAQFVSPHNLPVVYALQGGPGGAFEIDPATGRVTVGEPAFLDFEALRDAGYVEADGRVYYPITVYATDGLNSDSETFKIYIDDAPLTDADAADNIVNEHPVMGAYTGVTASLGAPVGAVFSLVTNPNEAFAINPATGEIVVADGSVLDFETLAAAGQVDANGLAYVDVVVGATTAAGTETSPFRIFIRDIGLVDDNDAENRVIERAAPGTSAGIKAMVPLPPEGEVPVYSLASNPYGAFTIHAGTGVIKVANAAALDFENLASNPAHVDAEGRVFVDVAVQATVGNGAETETFRVYIDDFKLVDVDSAANSVTDAPSFGTYTGATAGLLYGSTNGPVTYSLITDTAWSPTASNWGNMFQIDAATGRITTRENSSLDIDWLQSQGQVDSTGRAYQDLRVQASDGLNTEQESVRIYVEGYRAHTLYDADSGVNTVEEFSGTGTYTGVTARVVSKYGLEIQYYLNLARDGAVALTNAAYGWAIDIDTGVVTVNEAWAIDWDAQYGYAASNWYDNGYVPFWDGQQLYSQVVVHATDGVDVYERTFKVRITDAVHPAGFEVTDKDVAFNAIGEDAAAYAYIGLTAGMVKGETGITYSLANDAGGRFIIDPATGIVQVAPNAALDYETAPLLVGGPDRGYTIRIRAEDGVSVSERTFIIRVEDSASETLTGTPGDDVLTAPTHSGWTLLGLGGNDILTGRDGNDTLKGGDGNDLLQGGAGADILMGEAGTDTISYAGSSAGVSVNLATNVANGGDATGDVISGFENIIGSDHNDVLTGTNGANAITGGAGNDTLNGGGGNDTFFIGANSGVDAINGGSGTDLVRFTADNAVLALSSLASVEIFDATGFANVTITGTDANNNLNFASATLVNIASIHGLGGNDTITGSAGNDVIHGRGGNDVLRGGNGDDRFLFEGTGEGFDNIDGGAGDDRIEAMAANTVIGLSALTGVETIEGWGDTILQGSSGANTLDFSNVVLIGIARIDGGAGADTITGSVTQDVIRGGTGNDTLHGGDGDDIFLVRGTGDGADLYDGGAGYDQILAELDGTAIALGATIAGIERIAANGFANVRIVGTLIGNQWDFSGTILDGIVSIHGGAGDDTIIGSAGDDLILGGVGADILAGGGGVDTLGYTGSTLGVTVDLGTMTASGGDATGDVISGFRHVIGSNLADVLTGDDADNNLSGSGGVDRLTGGLGIDTLTGGSGKDVFVFNTLAEGAGDIITDFVRGQDKIELAAIDANAVIAGDQAFVFIGAAAFGGTAGQLRYDNGAGDGFTHVYADGDGDGIADFHLKLAGTYTLTATDFLV